MRNVTVTFGGGAAATFISPIVIIAMLLAIGLICTLPRKYSVIPFLLFVFLTPIGQQFTVGGLHFFAHRIIILFGCLRYFRGSRSLAGGLTRIDKLFLCWAVFRALAFMLLYRESGAVVNQLGFLWDALGGYFLLRCLIHSMRDIRRVAKVFVLIATVMAGCMVYEQVSVKNAFSVALGGDIAPRIRNGKVRARGVFAQEIIAGAFGGTLAPLFLWLWWGGGSRIGATIGLASSAVIVWSATSSTGVSAFIFGIGAVSLWSLRKHMRLVRWGIVILVLGLAISMKAPVWYLMARVDFTGGSTGWDRAYLVDQFVRHFWDWFLIGTNTNSSWGGATWDLCNQFVAEGEQGGILALSFFIMLICGSYSILGRARLRAEGDSKQEWLFWILGAVLTAHVAGFLGISYFDQSKYWWFATLAMICAATASGYGVARLAPRPSPQVVEGISLERAPMEQGSPA